MGGQWLDRAEDGARKTEQPSLWQEPVGQIGGGRPLVYLGFFGGWRSLYSFSSYSVHTSGSRSINIAILLDQFSLAIHSWLQQGSYIRVTRNARSAECAGLAC